tara:strand:+ start:38321 stop:38719 length:399 start_codon:yes stop_codon:yes gene_type:complete
MNESFLKEISDEDVEVVSKLRDIISTEDSLVTERIGKIMSSSGAFLYEQEGIFKYGLAKTTKHFTFHSMVMYAFPEVMKFSKSKFIGNGIKFQKGCVNFSQINLIDPEIFKEVVKFSSEMDFNTVITHYRKK